MTELIVDFEGKCIVLEDVDLFFDSGYKKGYRIATDKEIADAMPQPVNDIVACEEFGADCEHCCIKESCSLYNDIMGEINESMCCDMCGKEGIFGTCEACLEKEYHDCSDENNKPFD